MRRLGTCQLVRLLFEDPCRNPRPQTAHLTWPLAPESVAVVTKEMTAQLSSVLSAYAEAAGCHVPAHSYGSDQTAPTLPYRRHGRERYVMGATVRAAIPAARKVFLRL